MRLYFPWKLHSQYFRCVKKVRWNFARQLIIISSMIDCSWLNVPQAAHHSLSTETSIFSHIARHFESWNPRRDLEALKVDAILHANEKKYVKPQSVTANTSVMHLHLKGGVKKEKWLRCYITTCIFPVPRRNFSKKNYPNIDFSVGSVGSKHVIAGGEISLLKDCRPEMNLARVKHS